MESKTSKPEKIVVICAFLISLLFGVYFCCIKNGMSVDEMITIGQANSSKGGWISDVRDEYAEGDMTGHQLTGKEIFDFLTVDGEERFNICSPYNNLATDCHPPLYHMLLKVFSSFVTGSFSKWPGLILNLIIFLLCDLLILKICIRLFGNVTAASMTMLLYSLSLSTLSSLIFIRMYILLSLLTLLLLYEIIIVLGKPRAVIYPLIALTILSGMMTQYNYVFSAFPLCLFSLIVLLKRKEIKKAIWFSVSALAGVFLLFPVFPAFFDQLGFNSGAKDTVSVNSTIGNVLDFAGYPRTLSFNLQIFFSDSMASVEIAILLITVIMVAVMYLKYRKSEKGEDYTSYKLPGDTGAKAVLLISGLSLLFSFVGISVTVTFPDQRYFHHIQALFYIFICWLFCVALHYLNLKGNGLRTAVAFVSIAAVLATSILTLSGRGLPYLFSDYGDHAGVISGYKHCPCVYIDAGRFKMIDESVLQFMMYSDDAFITNTDNLGSEELKKYISEHQENGKMLVYVFELGDNTETILNELAASFGYKKNVLLAGDIRTPCYIIE